MNGTAVTCSNKGSILWEYWANYTNSNLDSLPVNTTPTGSQVLGSFNAPTNVTDHYGSRVRGYICPPVSGNYMFFIASDDDSRLWLSTDDSPANKVLIAHVTGWTVSGDYNKFASQKSALITLQANQRYYIEVRHRDGINGDHLSVGWDKPDGTSEHTIAGIHLIPYETPQDSLLMANNSSSNFTLLQTVKQDSELALSSKIGLTAYPNPFQQYVSLDFTTVEKEDVLLQIYSLQGVLLETLYKGKTEAFVTYNYQFDGSKYSNGTYLAKLICGNKTFTKLLILSH